MGPGSTGVPYNVTSRQSSYFGTATLTRAVDLGWPGTVMSKGPSRNSRNAHAWEARGALTLLCALTQGTRSQAPRSGRCLKGSSTIFPRLASTIFAAADRPAATAAMLRPIYASSGFNSWEGQPRHRKRVWATAFNTLDELQSCLGVGHVVVSTKLKPNGWDLLRSDVNSKVSLTERMVQPRLEDAVQDGKNFLQVHGAMEWLVVDVAHAFYNVPTVRVRKSSMPCATRRPISCQSQLTKHRPTVILRQAIACCWCGPYAPALR